MARRRRAGQLALALLLACQVAWPAAAQTVADDKAALLLFKNGGDPAGDLDTWSASDATNEPCNVQSWNSNAGWAGIRCTAADYNNGRVREVSFSHKSFTGDIGTLAALAALEKLELDRCAGVTGSVHELPLAGITTGLLWLNLADTAVTGSVDHLGLCTQLQFLALGNTGVTGSVEPLASCTELTTLSLPSTAVAGSVAELRTLTRLTRLTLSGTGVSGSVQTLGSPLTLLSHLDLSGTPVQGALSLGGCSALTHLDLTATSVSGSIEWLGGCSLLKTISLPGTSVSGSIAPLGALGDLWTLDLSEVGAGVSGSVEALASCTALRTLQLPGCGVSGSVEALASCTALTHLALARTSVGGRVGPLAGLAQLTVLTLTDTSAAGSVDSLASSLVSLTTLELERSTVYGNAAALRLIAGLGSNWRGFSACSHHTCADDEWGPGELVSQAYLRVGVDDCECCTPPVSFLREAESEICIAIRDCEGEWSECSSACESAESRSWVETASQSGTGAECPVAADCRPGEDECPPASNCTGSFSSCSVECELAEERRWEQSTPQVGIGTACPVSADCAAGEDDCIDPDGMNEQLILLIVGGGVPALTLFLGVCACLVYRRRRQRAKLDVAQAGLTLKTSNFRKAYIKSRPPQTREMLWSGVAELLQAYCARTEIPWQFEGDQFLRHLQQEADQNKHDSIPQAAQRMWTSPLRLRKKELCSILNYAVRMDSKEMVKPLATLTRAINLLCVTVGKSSERTNVPTTNLCFRGGGFDERHRDFFKENTKFRQPAYLATSFSKDVAKIFMGRASKSQAKVLWLVRIHPTRKCVHVNLVTKRVAGLGQEQEYLFAPYSVFTVRDVQWCSGTEEDPHVIELLAAPDNKDEPEDLPLAPWS